MTVKGGTSPACAACKYQRRRCSSKCPLAPYFPASDTHIFQNAHKLFGVSKIMRILRKLKTREEMDEAMKSIIYESNIREKFPVNGCLGYISILHQQVLQHTQELQYVRARLAMCEESGDQVTDNHYIPSSELQLGMASGSNPSHMPMLSYHPGDGTSMPYDMGNYAINENNKDVYFDCSDEIAKQLWAQDLNYNDGNNNQIAIRMQMDPSQAFQTQQETDYNDMPFDSMANDRQSYIVSKEACESSCGSAWKDTTENVSKNELKNAAAYFSLTSVN